MDWSYIRRAFIDVHEFMVAFDIKLMGENFLLQAHFIGTLYFLADVGITIILNYA